jgi:hypothetical protein
MKLQLPLLDFRPYQKGIWNYMMQNQPGLRALLVWPRRNGKDLVSLNILISKALQRVGLYQYIAPYSNQVRSIIWEGSTGDGRKFIDYIPDELIERKLDQQMKIWMPNGSLIHLVGSDNPDAVVGTNPVGQVYTEMSLHKPGIWNYMRPVLAENGGWALFNGTPRGMNHFYQMAETAKRSKSWFFQRLTAEETGVPTKHDIEEERLAGMAESLIEQEFYTSWTASSEETLIPLDFLQKAQNVEITADEYEFAPRIIGVDPAYAEKGDTAVIVRRQGRRVWPLDVYQGIDPMALAAKVAEYLKHWHAHYCFVDAGRGEAVWSRLHQLGHEARVFPVHFGGKTYSDLYARKKDEIWGRMKEYICDPLTPFLPDDPELVTELSSPTFEINERGLMQVESKKSLKKRGFQSPGRGDALALTFSEELDETPVLTERMKQLGVTENVLQKLSHRNNGTRQEDYDPLNYMEDYARANNSFI